MARIHACNETPGYMPLGYNSLTSALPRITEKSRSATVGVQSVHAFFFSAVTIAVKNPINNSRKTLISPWG